MFMVLEKLGDALKDGIKRLVSKVLIDEKSVNEFIKDIQRAMITGDVDVKLVFELTKNIKDEIMKSKAFSKKEQIVKIVYDNLVRFLGGEGDKISTDKKPTKILLVGTFGSGKTTTSGKIAKYFKKKGLRVGLLGLDTFRAAAMEQIEQVGAKIQVPVMTNKKEKKPGKIVNEYKDEFKKYDILIADSAGRDSLDDELIKEVKSIKDALKPDEILLVIPADMGQAAKVQATEFHKALGITGIIITKLDGTAKGGGALSACAVSGAPVKFIGVGESVEDFELFNPKRFVSRLLGMGDLESLLEKAKEELDVNEVKDLGEKLLSGKFNLLDLYAQLQAVGKMGSFSKILGFIPGLSSAKLPQGMLDIQEDNVKKFRYIMDSMTKDELDNPKILSQPRIDRIAKGAGVEVKDVRALIKQYQQMKGMVKKMQGGNLKNVMKKLGIKDLKQLENIDIEGMK